MPVAPTTPMRAGRRAKVDRLVDDLHRVDVDGRVGERSEEARVRDAGDAADQLLAPVRHSRDQRLLEQLTRLLDPGPLLVGDVERTCSFTLWLRAISSSYSVVAIVGDRSPRRAGYYLEHDPSARDCDRPRAALDAAPRAAGPHARRAVPPAVDGVAHGHAAVA